MKITREELLEKLQEIAHRQEGYSDIETDHVEADNLLLTYLNLPEITEVYCRIKKWYA